MMDPDIRQALSDIKESVRDGFSSVNKRIDVLVTKGEFDAEVRRIDAQHAGLRRDHETLSRKAEEEHAGIREEVHDDLEGFRVTTRWAVGLAASGAAIAVTFLAWVLPI